MLKLRPPSRNNNFITSQGFSFFFSSHFNQNDKSSVQVKKGLKYFIPSQKIRTIFTQRFDFMFDQIKYSLVTQGFFSKLYSFYKWKTQYPNLSIPQNLQQLQETLPVNKNPDFTCVDDKIKYTWLGHSSAVISVGGKINILIDPVFSQRCSPFKSIGPKRYRDVPCEIDHLPKIDIVLISHDHYDHLDSQALHKLQKLHNPTFIAGLNSRDIFPPNSTLHQLDWTETKKIIVSDSQQIEITFVPACHWSRRGLMDLGKRLWGGFVIKTSKGNKIYYSGDTGYSQLFKEIYDVFGEMDLCILPIGVYEPREFLKNQHFNPEDAVIVHKQLRSKKSVGVHWGTFPLSNEKWDAPRHDLKQAIHRHGLKEDQFLAIGHGDSFQIDY